jgi:hypothetical protein
VPDVPAERIFDVGALRDATEAAFASFALHSASELAMSALATPTST